MEVRTMADHSEPSPDDLACIEFVDVVTDYLDGEVNERQRRRIDRHLEGCEGCRATLDQFQTVIRLAGRLTAADVANVDALVRDRLMATLRVARRR
jgi:predicted anti-sigma-YlaC factor YlaD